MLNWSFIIESNPFIKCMMVSMVVGVLSWMILSLTYRSMLRSTEKLGATKKKWLVALRSRYMDYYKREIKINNVDVFVEKIYAGRKVLGLSCPAWQTLERLTIVVCAMAGAGGALLLSQQGAELTDIMFTYLFGVTGACGLLFLDVLQHAEYKQNLILTNIKHFLENVLDHRMRGEEPAEASVNMRRNHRKTHPTIHMSQLRKKVSKEEQELVDDMIQEFFA